MQPSQTELLAFFSYDPVTGYLTHKGRRRGWKQIRGWRHVRFGKLELKEHRVIWAMMTGVWPSEIDHINGIRDDNRWVNLRLATRSQNVANSRARAAFKGAYQRKSTGRWMASIKVAGKPIYLGDFNTAQEAHAAYCAAADKHFGSFARY